ncbi:putative syntaxin 6 [Dioscorea sansibarensis]
MVESFGRWESDPLFSAAEVVQDSADRMESAFRMLLHEQKLVQGESSDSRLLGQIQYHRRDLLTALETTKWQLEDFERAVNFAASSDKSNSRQNAMVKHREFIRAIREQSVQVERGLASSMTDFDRNSQWAALNEQDRDGLASFLSGGDSNDRHAHYDPGNSGIMRRFLDSNLESDEIVEVIVEEGDNPEKYGLGARTLCENSVTEVEQGELNTSFADNDLENGELGRKCHAYSSRFRRIPIWRFFRNFQLANVGKRSFAKRRKDGEVTDDVLADTRGGFLSSTFNISPAEQDKYVCSHLGIFPISNILQFIHSHRWVEAFRRKVQRTRYDMLHYQFPTRLLSAILITLAVLGEKTLPFLCVCSPLLVHSLSEFISRS